MPIHPGKASTAQFLQPERDIEIVEGGYRALSSDPWLRLNAGDTGVVGRWSRIAYRSSFLDRLVRPVLRLEFAEGFEDIYFPGALLGRGEWLGFIPANARGMLISPVDRSGVFGFEIEACEPLSGRAMFAAALKGSPDRIIATLIARARGMPMEAIDHMSHMIGAHRFGFYKTFRRDRSRPFDVAGIDRPRHDWSATPHIRLATLVGAGDIADLKALLDSLRRQPYSAWSVIAVLANASPGLARQLGELGEERLSMVAASEGAESLTRALGPLDIVGRCAPGDRLPESALAILAEAAADDAASSLFYGDEEQIRGDGHATPLLKPDWSALFQTQTNYVGGAVFARAARLRNDQIAAGSFANPSTPIDELFAIGREPPAHVRRILLSRAAPAPRRAGDPVAPGAARAGFVSIIIPIRDKVHLLKACVDSIVAKSAAVEHEVIVVDNGSAEQKTLDYLLELEKRDGFHVLRRPIPFNFSRLCNDGAAIAKGDIFVFLNNDTEVISDNWLEPLAALAAQPLIGAVGPKLLFKSGRVQHAGVVIGLFGRADHVGGGSWRGAEGYLGQLAACREVSAVTGACLAIERGKFDAIGGFDAENLPVDLNDIDLCLRLREKGLVNLYTPASVLYHYESATRGIYDQPAKKYAKERAYFTPRWRGAVRDDPYFHPALSLHSIKPALG